VRDALRGQRRRRLQLFEDVVRREGQRQVAEIERTIDAALVGIHRALESDLAQRAGRRAELLDTRRTMAALEQRLVSTGSGRPPASPFERPGGADVVPLGSLPPGWDSEELWVCER
jgi:hypothetical protein